LASTAAEAACCSDGDAVCPAAFVPAWRSSWSTAADRAATGAAEDARALLSGAVVLPETRID
jgi:hypothetical protein